MLLRAEDILKLQRDLVII
ncbi:hypothetical protein A2U01_0094015, partial [Trifolium medium]|nr:hypothetical protein [Trifolium medium]